ncbi:MAG: hypothetical protein M1831_005962 [Alyxoria varia]|nr:MAG: hypothetical protein M1831_005962 [Alyxoria varia]
MASSLQSRFSYILLRLLAIVGILFLLERSSEHLLRSQESYHLSEGGYGLKAIAYRDGSMFHSLRRFVGSRTKSKAIVAASLSGDNTTWIKEHLPEWEANVYGTVVMNDAGANLTVAKNKGNEASAYLTYLITHYHNLPHYMVFIHAKRYQWHNDDPMYDHVPIIRNLRLAHVEKAGYTSLRCTWEPDPKSDDGLFAIRAAYSTAFQQLFPSTNLPEKIGHPCCAQFAVSRARVVRNPVHHYEKVRQWVWETDLPAVRSGRVLEYMWHMLFGEAAVDCEGPKECFCQKFGHCDLTCDESSCEGRYHLPSWNESLPERWPEEGQGKNGWPVDRWWEAGRWE